MNRLALLLCLTLCGCGIYQKPVNPPRPEPEPSVYDVQAPYRTLRLSHARIEREAAAKARSGEIKSQAEESAFLDPAKIKARLDAFAPTAAAEQAALGDGKWTPERMATFREALADALEAEQ